MPLIKYYLQQRNKKNGKKVENEEKTCFVCAFECDSAKELKTHKLKHQDEHKNKLCFYCEKKFKCSSNLRVHIDRMHPERPNAQNQVCHVCGFSTLSKHMMQGNLLKNIDNKTVRR